MRKRVGRSISLLAMTLAIGSAALPAFAHLHTLDPDDDGQPLKTGQGEVVYLAKGANHPEFKDMDGDGKLESCESYILLPGFGPAWYGLETAHHGPDSGDEPGKGDGCYETDSTPAADDQNPAIGP